MWLMESLQKIASNDWSGNGSGWAASTIRKVAFEDKSCSRALACAAIVALAAFALTEAGATGFPVLRDAFLRRLDPVGVDVHADANGAGLARHATGNASRSARHLEGALSGTQLQQAEELERLGRREPAGLAEILVVGTAADGHLGVGRQLAVVRVVELHFLGHRRSRPPGFLRRRTAQIPMPIDASVARRKAG